MLLTQGIPTTIDTCTVTAVITKAFVYRIILHMPRSHKKPGNLSLIAKRMAVIMDQIVLRRTMFTQYIDAEGATRAVGADDPDMPAEMQIMLKNLTWCSDEEEALFNLRAKECRSGKAEAELKAQWADIQDKINRATRNANDDSDPDGKEADEDSEDEVPDTATTKKNTHGAVFAKIFTLISAQPLHDLRHRSLADFWSDNPSL